MVQAIQTKRGLSSPCFLVHPFFPENFFIVFDSHSNKDRILHGESRLIASFFNSGNGLDWHERSVVPYGS